MKRVKKEKFRVIRILLIVFLLHCCVMAVSAKAIGYGEYVNGTISTPAMWDTYSMSGSAGDPIYLRLKTSWPFSGQIRVYAPNGTMIASPQGQYGTELSMILPVTGTYTLMVGDSGGDNTGSYDLYLQRTKNAANPALVQYGDHVNGTIPHQSLYRTYTFSGTVGDPVYLRLKTSWPFSGQIRVYAPNGTMIASPEGQYGTELTMILPVTGTFTLLVGDSGGDNTGTYDLYLQRTKNPGNTVLISYSDNVNGIIPHRALYDTYVFSGSAGDMIYLRLKTSWPFSGQIRLYAPNGTLISSPEGQSGTELTTILPVTGTYTLLVGDSGGDNTGTYNLYLQFIVSLAVTSNFSASPTSGTIPLVVEFMDESSNEPYAWIWDFGDGNSSPLQNPSNTYAYVGHYSVNLTATNTYGSNATLKPKYITATYAVIPLPGYPLPPTDPDDDFIFEDLNGNGRLDFADVVLYFNQMEWIAAHEPVGAFDLNGNGRIDFADIVKLFGEI